MQEGKDGRLGVGLGTLLLLGDDLAADDVLAHIVFFGEVEELADLGRTLGTEAGQHVRTKKKREGRQAKTDRLGRTVSVRPGISCSPCLTMMVDRTAMSVLTMQPRTDLRRRSPARRSR